MWKATGTTCGCPPGAGIADSQRSAGGQLEQPSEVYSSTRAFFTGPERTLQLCAWAIGERARDMARATSVGVFMSRGSRLPWRTYSVRPARHGETGSVPGFGY